MSVISIKGLQEVFKYRVTWRQESLRVEGWHFKHLTWALGIVWGTMLGRRLPRVWAVYNWTPCANRTAVIFPNSGFIACISRMLFAITYLGAPKFWQNIYVYVSQKLFGYTPKGSNISTRWTDIADFATRVWWTLNILKIFLYFKSIYNYSNLCGFQITECEYKYLRYTRWRSWRYKPEGRGFDSRNGHLDFSLTGQWPIQSLTEMSSRDIFRGRYRRPMRGAENLNTFKCRLSRNTGRLKFLDP